MAANPKTSKPFRKKLRIYAICISGLLFLTFTLATHYQSFPPFDFQNVKKLKSSELTDLFERRMKLYEEDHEKLSTNIKLQGLFIVLGLILIHFPLRKFNIQALGITVPVIYVQAFVPLAILYLWLNFGYILHSQIENRIFLYQMVEQADHNKLIAKDPFSKERLLRDEGFIDEYFVAFHDNVSGLDETGHPVLRLFDRLVLVAAGVFFGLGQGIMFASVVSLSGEVKPSRKKYWCAITYMCIVATFLLCTHLQFYLVGQHKNWLQFIILGACFASTLVLSLDSVQHCGGTERV